MSIDNSLNDIVTKEIFEGDSVIEQRTQNIERSMNPEGLSQNKYKPDSFGCVYAATIPSGLVEMMMKGTCCNDGKTYNVLGNDPEEYRRALVHLQENHKELLIVNGKPFAKKRSVWQ